MKYYKYPCGGKRPVFAEEPMLIGLRTQAKNSDDPQVHERFLNEHKKFIQHIARFYGFQTSR